MLEVHSRQAACLFQVLLQLNMTIYAVGFKCKTFSHSHFYGYICTTH